MIHSSIARAPSDVGCRATAEVELAGSSVAAQKEEAFAGPVEIQGPYDTVAGPSIRGMLAPWHRLTCSLGRWEGSPNGYSYMWSSADQLLGEAQSYEVLGLSEGSTLTCAVTAHYGTIAVTARTSVRLPTTPLPVECAGRQVVLISARRAGKTVLLFGDAAGEDFGGRVYAMTENAHGPPRRVAAAKVGGEGYFLLRVALREGVGTGTRFFAVAGGRRSNAMSVPRALQIVADSSSAGRSRVTLALARRLGGGATMTVSRITERCGRDAPILTTHLSPGGTLGVTLTAEGEANAVGYVAEARIGRRSYSVELVVPPPPEPVIEEP